MIPFSRLSPFLFTATVWSMAVSPETFYFSKSLLPPDTLAFEIGVFRFDREMYRHTNNNLSDFRLYDGSGKEVPYLVRCQTEKDTETVRYQVPMERVKFEAFPDNHMEIVFRRELKDSSPIEFNLSTTARNFEKSVSVYGSNDDKNWLTLAEHQPIFDYAQFIDVRNTAVSFKKMNCHYYRVTIDNVRETKRLAFSQIEIESGKNTAAKKYETFMQGSEPFRIEEILFYGTERKVRENRHFQAFYPVGIERTVPDTADNSTIIYCRSNREPLLSMSLSTASTIFRRKVYIDGTDDTLSDSSWTSIASTEMYRIKIRNIDRENLDIPFENAQRYLRYRLRIVNGDNQPINVTSVAAKGNVHEVLFLNENVKMFKVYYCADAIDLPNYDIASLLSDAPPVNGQNWLLSPQSFTGIKREADKSKNNIFIPKTILFVSLIVMVAILAAVLFVTTKKVEKQTHADQKE